MKEKKEIENWPRAVIGLTRGECVKIKLLQKEWGWSYAQVFTQAFREGLKTMDVNRFPEVNGKAHEKT